jgi:hypothetical protein
MHLWEVDVYTYPKVSEACIKNDPVRRDKGQREIDHRYDLRKGLLAKGPTGFTVEIPTKLARYK